MIRNYWYIIAICLRAITSQAQTATNAINNPPSIFDLMHFQEVLEAELTTDITALKADRFTDDYRPATLTFLDQQGQLQKWELKTRLRGKFRRIRCEEMPPLKLKFKKSDLAEAGLSSFNDMKLVSFCMSDLDEAEKLLKREYLAYKLYNELSEYSFRVQLLNIVYRDSKTNETSEQWAFLIEDLAQLRSRFNAEKCDDCFMRQASEFQVTELNKVAVFQYMIGNSDWSPGTLRNIKLLIKDNKFIPVPYDFDFSGLVNSSYAIPNVNYGLRSVTDRAYLGLVDPSELNETLDFYRNKRADLLQVIKDMKLLKGADRSEAALYLKSFFRDMNEIEMAKQVDLAQVQAGTNDHR